MRLFPPDRTFEHEGGVRLVPLLKGLIVYLRSAPLLMFLLAGSVLAACGDDDPVLMDAAVFDAPLTDAPRADAGPSDGGQPDAAHLCPATCDGVCMLGEQDSEDCDDVCDVGENASPDCDEICLEGETGPDCDGICATHDDRDGGDCDGVCGADDAMGGPDCNGICEPGETAEGADCDESCDVGDSAEGVDCDGLCDAIDGEGPDCDDVCDGDELEGSPDCDMLCGTLDALDGPDCDRTCDLGESRAEECNGWCELEDGPDSADCDGVCNAFDAETPELTSPDCRGFLVDDGNTGRNLDIAIGDINGDGLLDAVGTRHVTQNDGAPRWIMRRTQDLGSAVRTDVELADVDGDGDLDLVAAVFVTSRKAVAPGAPNQVWLNDGDGVFSLSSSFGTGRSRAIALGDLDGDGDLDVFVGNFRYPSVTGPSTDSDDSSIWLNAGDGTFVRGQRFDGRATEDVALFDIDGDGDLDAIRASAPSTAIPTALQIYVNDGSATFSLGQAFETNDRLNMFTLGDLGDDGLVELVTNRRAVWRNVGGMFVEVVAAATFAPAVVLGDFDGDGELDLLSTLDMEQGVALFGWDPITQGWQSPTGFSSRHSRGVSISAADLDGDGDLDAIVASHQDRDTVLHNNNQYLLH